jgi:hypothetical protein
MGCSVSLISVSGPDCSPYLQRFPQANIPLLDISEAVPVKARERFTDKPERFAFQLRITTGATFCSV